MGNKVDLINEIYTRISTAIGESGALYGVKSVRIGSVEEARHGNDLPIVIIQLQTGQELAHYHNKEFVDQMVILVRLVASKLAAASNTLYNSDSGTGAIFLLEKILNVIDKNTSGVVDLTFANKANNLVKYTYTIDESNDVVDVLVQIELQTHEFFAGGR